MARKIVPIIVCKHGKNFESIQVRKYEVVQTDTEVRVYIEVNCHKQYRPRKTK